MKDVKNNLINQSLLEKKLKDYKEIIKDNSQIFLKWHNETRNERKIQANFLNDIFGNILGYEFETDKEEYNLDYEQTTDKSRKPVDGVLGFFTKENRKIKVIIELKGKDTKNINTIEQQAFDYLKEFSDVDYIITSNTETIRLYSKKHMSVKYIEWTMLELSNNLEKQKEFHFFLAKGRLFVKEGISEVAKLIEENIKEEKEIKDKFYKEYKEKRVKLINEIKLLNPNIDAISKAQKLLDRMLFVRFCIDRGYITQNIVKTVENLIKLRFTFYQALKVLFETIDKGSGDEIKDDYEKIIAWNGGLFAEDIELNELQIGSEILKEIDKFFKSYNFSSQVDVHILGHIFEQSISDIEKLKEGGEFDAKQGKRKKDGVFYTPEYITKYIVEEAVGGWLADRKLEIKAKENTKEWWKEYAEKLQSIKVLDPACGSGAFLVEVFNYLENEWNIIRNSISNLKGDLFDFDWNYKDTLKNNIYGVDINFESVQITRLSLWIQTAHNKTALVSLDNNIKCGNSLIDDPEIAGEKAFKWEEEFLFKFDVVVGNPPYVGQKGNSELFIPFQKLYPEFYDRKQDLYYYFIYKGLSLLNQNGYISFIIPPYFLTATSAINLRKEILKNEIKSFLEIKANVFDSASIHSLIFLFKKHKANENNFNVYQLEKEKSLINTYNQNELTQDNWYILGRGKDIDIKAECKTLGEIARISPGIQTGFDKAYIIKKEELSKFNEEERKFIKKFYKNSHIQRYNIQDSEEFIIITNEIEDIKKYPNIEKHLLKFKNELDKRFRNFTLKNADKEGKWWFMYGYRPNTNFEREKILIPYRSSQNNFIISREEFYSVMDVFYIDIVDKDFSLEYVSCILSSKFIYHYLLKNCKKKGDVFEFVQEPLKTIPIPQIPLTDQQPLITHAQTMLTLTKQLNEIVSSFYDYLFAKLGNPTKDLNKLKNWHKLDNSGFLELINKVAKTQKISIDDEALLGKFKEKISITNDLQNKISCTDSEIDKMVYALYGLSKEEIGVVEGEN